MRQLQERGLTHLGHLSRRFFGHVRARPLGPSEQAIVTAALPPQLRRLFYRQAPGDQRHALDVYLRLEDPTPIEAQVALLHDVGKHDVRLGAMGRSLATVWSWTGLPISGSWRAYIEHGRRGAEMLEAASADPFVVVFTRRHPGPVPDGFDSEAWARLAAADHDG